MTNTDHQTDVHSHQPSDAQYIQIAVFLAVATGIEVALKYTHIRQGFTNTMLLGLAALKFATVALFFMHLKYDNRILRRLFTGGFVLAVCVYIPVLFMFHAFSS